MNEHILSKIIRIAIINVALVLIAVAIIFDKGIKFIAKPRYNELVFVTPSVIRTEEFDNRLPHHAEIIYLDKNKSGVLQITEYLARKEEIDAVRILSHGNPGFFELNGEIIDRRYLAENGTLFKSWKASLSEDADIMLYGCNIAATKEGRELVQQLAELTGADVAAATHEVGGMLANWTLDYHAGTIDAAVLRMDDYEFHLDTTIVSNSNDSGAGSLRKAISDAASGDTIVFKLNSANDTIKLTSGELVVDKGLTIDGNNALGSGDTVVVSGESNFSVITIDAGNDTIMLKNIFITKGLSDNNYGAGIYNKASILSLESVSVSGNEGYGILNGTSATISSILNSKMNDNGLNGLLINGTVYKISEVLS
jgi:hypothetical protein